MGNPDWDNDPRLQAYLREWREYGPLTPPHRERPPQAGIPVEVLYRTAIIVVAVLAILVLFVIVGGFR